jgi:hypothetical protein
MSALELTRHLGGMISTDEGLSGHPAWPLLAVVLGGETSVSSAGFPYISDSSFRLSADRIPHLFVDGTDLLGWMDDFERRFEDGGGLSVSQRESVGRAAKVVRNMVLTAAVTAPPDLWVLRQVLAAHRRLGVLAEIEGGDVFNATSLAKSLDLSEAHLSIDLHLLHSRGYLERAEEGFVITGRPSVVATLQSLDGRAPELRIDWVPELVAWLDSTAGSPGADPGDLLSLPEAEAAAGTGTWVASASQLELGYRLLPLVLALRVSGRTGRLDRGADVEAVIGPRAPLCEPLLEACGLIDAGRVTTLGDRVFTRGPGPFGIISAYHPYFAELDQLLRPGDHQVWVRRAQNVAASQDANSRTFAAANDSLDAFCERYDFDYGVFIEHAVGQGEAIRQRFHRPGGEVLRYFGADLEDAAIDQAERQQTMGRLPANMEFVRRADIGEPERVIEYLRTRGVETRGAVMMVGNGFHEIRDQTRDKMTEVFSGYQSAGMVVIFTEETALSDQDLRATAWNTYHAGFRYVHEMSGQGLRPSRGAEGGSGRWSWRRCARAGGYCVLEDFSYRSRSIFPYRRPDRDNPVIRMSYFCVPRDLVAELEIDCDG